MYAVLKRYPLSLLQVLFVGLFLLCCSSAWADEAARVLIMPFKINAGESRGDLESFADHTDKKLRATIEMLGNGFSCYTQKETAELLNLAGNWATDSDARKIAESSGADLAVYGFLSEEDSKFQLKATMWDVRTSRPFVSIDLKIANIHGLPEVLQLFVSGINKRLQSALRLPFYRTEISKPVESVHSGRLPALVGLTRNMGPWRSPEIPSSIVSVDMGDLDGDKRNETVILEESSLTISRFEDGSLRPLTQFSQSPAVYLNAEIEDIDGDGIPELILCYQSPSGVESAIVKYAERNFRIFGKYPNVILRTIKDPGDPRKKILVGQATDRSDFFSGEMLRFSMSNSELVRQGTVALPPGTFLLSYDSGALGKKGEFVQVIIGQDLQLAVFDSENRPLSAIKDKTYGLDKKLRFQSGNGVKEIVFPGRLLITDTRNDTGQELLVARHSDGNSLIQALSWDGRQLIEKWTTARNQGIISDFRLKDFKNEGTKSLVIVLVKPPQILVLTGPRSVIFAYDLVP